MYGGATKPSSYCKISTYLQHNANLLYDNVESLCLFGNFTPRKGGGVTFVLPDPNVLKRIDALVGTDPEAAVKMIRSYTFPVYLHDIEAFGAVSGLTNNNGERLSFTLDNNKTQAKVGDMVVTVLPQFKALYNTSNINIFQGKGMMTQSSRGGARVAVNGGGDNITPVKKTPTSVSAMFNVVKACIEACMGTDNPDPLTHLTLSLYNGAVGEEGKKAILSTFMSPTDSLFFMALFKDVAVNDYYMKRTANWSDKGVVVNITNKKVGNEYYAKMWADKKKYLTSGLASDTLVSKIVEAHTAAAIHVIQSEGGVETLFKDKQEGLANFLLVKNEFAHIYGGEYANAYVKRDMATIKKIFHVFHNLYLPHILEQTFDKARQLSDDKIAEKLNGEVTYFCAVLSFYVNVYCGGVGVYAGVTQMKNFPNTVASDVQMKPNNVQQTSSLATVAKLLDMFT